MTTCSLFRSDRAPEMGIPFGRRFVYLGHVKDGTVPQWKNPRLVSSYRMPMSVWSTMDTQRNSPVGKLSAGYVWRVAHVAPVS